MNLVENDVRLLVTGISDASGGSVERLHVCYQRRQCMLGVFTSCPQGKSRDQLQEVCELVEIVEGNVAVCVFGGEFQITNL